MVLINTICVSSSPRPPHQHPLCPVCLIFQTLTFSPPSPRLLLSPKPHSPPSTLTCTAIFNNHRGWNAKMQTRKLSDQFSPQVVATGGDYILLHADVLYLIDSNEQVKSPVMWSRLAGMGSWSAKDGVATSGTPTTRQGKCMVTLSPTTRQGKGMTTLTVVVRAKGTVGTCKLSL